MLSLNLFGSQIMQIVHGPRPEGRIRPDQLAFYEATGDWCVQRKFNGYKCTFSVCDGKVNFYNKGKPFKRWKPPASLLKQFSALNLKPGTHWFDSELLEPRVKNTIVIYDVLQFSRYLIGTTQIHRLNLLDEICGKPRERCDLGIAILVTENIWLAEWWEEDFEQHYEEMLDMDLIEGLVLRQKEAKLNNHGRVAYETQSQIRCRKNSANYRF